MHQMRELQVLMRAKTYFGYNVTYTELANFLDTLSHKELMQFYDEIGM